MRTGLLLVTLALLLSPKVQMWGCFRLETARADGPHNLTRAQAGLRRKGDWQPIMSNRLLLQLAGWLPLPR